MTIHKIDSSKVGRTMFYLTSKDEMRNAICEESFYNVGIGKFIHVGISPNGHVIKLTDDEIYCWGTEVNEHV